MKISPSYMRFYVTVLATLLVFSLRDMFAQDLGALARQERAKRLARQSRVTKVFTNEDLKRDVIISEEERAAMERQPGDAAVLAESMPASDSAPGAPVPIHLTLAAPALPGKQSDAPVRNFTERAVPTVPLWPAAMPLGDVARYYRQQVAPQLPSIDDAVLAEALAHAPMLRDFAADKLRMTFAPLPEPTEHVAPVAAQRTARPALSELNLPAPFVLASAEGSRVPVIENVSDDAVPAFPSPAINLRRAESETVLAASAPRADGVRFEAPQLGDVVVTFGANASLSIASLAGGEAATPMFDSSREPLVIRFKGPQPAPQPTAERPAPLARTEDPIGEPIAAPQLRAGIASTASLETVSPWRYVDEMPAAPPAPLKFTEQPDAARPVVISTDFEAAAAAEELAAELTSTEEAETLEVRVQSGDSLWKLAARHLGDGHAWPRIAAANPQISNPNRILAGELLAIPGVTNLAAAPISKPVVASTNAGKSVTVRRGDSLWKLAESALGSGAAWNCIVEANPQITDADHILAGQTLILPTNCNPQS